ncbi:GMC family oxidoreductase [Actinokineospora sp. NBRC 105648]|uniref:GMC family oxidoreductase n=1 Tax=Actinokineospora sp. NBRC 105648 TaxID=3032206 RepID=UPI0024A551D7|nr:GMC family oxidoreductase [Actinokineospora sp. NBRC 105648]GLZ37119.1 putative glucose-methanol-choline oxidoreductase [Actinokineospora sp. NBRC 105648]
MTDSDFPSHHDVLVLGGGVAGCVLAARLSADTDRSVCLVEAGPDYGPDSPNWPQTMLDARVLPRDEVWETEPAPHRIRAKVLGGSSCINGCWHTWGSEQDHAGWAARGGPDWSAAGLEPFRQVAVERMRLRAIPDAELSVWSSGALAAAAELGYPEVADLAAPGVGPGYGCPPVNAIGDLRWNAAFAYLNPARDRPNLSILSGTTVHRLIVRAGVVQGVEVDQGGTPRTLTADTYILTAGAYGSPAVLLRSGIGPADHLSELGVPVEVDLPAVGSNLTDHPCLVLPLTPTAELNAALARKEAAGELYASQVALKAASELCPEGGWDLHLLPTAGPPLFGSLPPGEYEVGIAAFLMSPLSRGSLRLRSADPDVPVDIDLALFTDPDGRDLAVARDGLRLAAELAASSALKSWATPAAGGDPAALGDDELRSRAGTYWHPVGTCAMGTGDDAVVDPEGRVRGVANLRVVDASILPTVPAANTQLPVLAVAELLAERLIRG